MKRSVAMIACVLSGALMIGSYSPVLAEGAKAVSAKSAAQESEDTENTQEKTEETKTDESSEEAKADDTAKGDVLEDGVYTAEFETDSSMFHVNEANDGKGILTVKDGQMSIHISLTSKNIVNLFVGKAADAKKDGAELLQPTTDTVTYDDGTTEEVNGFDVPVKALDKDFDLALIGTKGKWYDHTVSVTNPVKVD